MATLKAIYDARFAVTSELRQRTAAAVAAAAQDIKNEDPSTTQHAERLLWAKSALADANAMAERMMWDVLANPTIETALNAASDADVQWTVNSLVNAYLDLGYKG